MQLADRQLPFLDRIAALPYVRQIYLVGSRARGDHRPKSDIDLAVDCPGADVRQWQRVLDEVESAETLLGVDCIRYDTLMDSDLRQRIDADKRALLP